MEFYKYRQRRKKLLMSLPHSSIVILPGSQIFYRNADTEWTFRQNSDFFYLTGFEEPNACLILLKNKRDEISDHLFIQEKDQATKRWTGINLGCHQVKQQLEFSDVRNIHKLETSLTALAMGKSHIVYPFGLSLPLEGKIHRLLEQLKYQHRKGIGMPNTSLDLSVYLQKLRIIKDKSEIDLIKKAVIISANAHTKLMQQCHPGMYEYQLEAIFRYYCMTEGCHNLAYPAIIGTGQNACILHYTKNNTLLNDGDLVLIDAGGEYQNYAADITRTFPVNGQYTSAQHDLYECVLASQQAGLSCIKPGQSWHMIQKAIVDKLIDGLLELKILHGSKDEIMETEKYKRFYMHSSGHWLGLDVHDAGPYLLSSKGKWQCLSPNMVLTIEPGIYISKDEKDVPNDFLGTGIRIEDDILVTTTGYEILSYGVPKKIEEIEALMKGA